jgi:hypothetical protein
MAFEEYYQPGTEAIKDLFAIKESIRKKTLLLPRMDAATARFAMQAVRIVESSADLSHLALMMRLTAKPNHQQ